MVEYLTGNEAAKLAGVHPRTVYREAARGHLAMIRPGGTARGLFRADEAAAWAARRRRKPYRRPRDVASSTAGEA